MPDKKVILIKKLNNQNHISLTARNFFLKCLFAFMKTVIQITIVELAEAVIKKYEKCMQFYFLDH